MLNKVTEPGAPAACPLGHYTVGSIVSRGGRDGSASYYILLNTGQLVNLETGYLISSPSPTDLFTPVQKITLEVQP